MIRTNACAFQAVFATQTFDCTSNDKITNLTRIIDIDNDDSLNGVDNLNKYEAEFWQNTLICSQLYPKGHEKYKLKNNRCCRDNSLKFSIPTITVRNANQENIPNDSFTRIKPKNYDSRHIHNSSRK